MIAKRTAVADAVGKTDHNRAMAPVTNGAAALVPLKCDAPPVARLGIS